MALVYNTIDKVGGDPQSLSVRIEILWDKNDHPVAVHTDEERMCDGPIQFRVDKYGYWELELQPNDMIDPVDNVYRVTHWRNDDLLNSITYYMYVMSMATPTFWAGHLIVDKPTWVTDQDHSIGGI